MRERISALIIKDKKLLLVSSDGSWYWTPGGRREVGEDDQTTLYRELDEELNIVPEKTELYKKYYYPAGEKTANFVAPEGEETDYIVTFSGRINPSAEVKIAEWFSGEEAMRIPLLKSFKENIIESLIKDGLL